MARIFKGSQFYLPPTLLSTNGMNHAFPAEAGFNLPILERDGRLSWPIVITIVSKLSVHNCYVTVITVLAAQTVTPHLATGNAAGDERRTHDLSGRKQHWATESPEFSK